MKKLFILFLIVFIYSCTERQVTQKLTRYWSVAGVDYAGKEYGLFFFYDNKLVFSKNGTCEIPYFEYSIHRGETFWKILKTKGDIFYIEIYGSREKFLDGIF